MRFTVVVLNLIVTLAAATAGAAECRKVDSVCIDETAVKVIGIVLDIKQIETKDGRLADYRQPYEVPWCPSEASFAAPLFHSNRQGV